MRFQSRLPSLQLSINIFALRMTQMSSVRHKIEDGGSGLSVSWISSNNEESSLILLVKFEMFLICTKETFSIDVTSFEIWINDSSNVPTGRNPEETIRGDDNKMAGGRGKFEILECCHLEGIPVCRVSHIPFVIINSYQHIHLCKMCHANAFFRWL